MSRGKVIKNIRGRDLKAARLKLGLTQEQVARRLGISQSYWSNAENGNSKITRQLLHSFKMMRQLHKGSRKHEGEVDYVDYELERLQI